MFSMVDNSIALLPSTHISHLLLLLLVKKRGIKANPGKRRPPGFTGED